MKLVWVYCPISARRPTLRKKYLVTLTAQERQQLQALLAGGKSAAKKLTHARILLKADQASGGPAWEDARIAEALDVGHRTVGRVRQRFVAQGLQAALVRKPQEQPSRPRKLDGRAEARLLAVACSPAPRGHKVWTLQLLAEQLLALRVVDSVADETVRRLLNKTNSSRG